MWPMAEARVWRWLWKGYKAEWEKVKKKRQRREKVLINLCRKKKTKRQIFPLSKRKGMKTWLNAKRKRWGESSLCVLYWHRRFLRHHRPGPLTQHLIMLRYGRTSYVWSFPLPTFSLFLFVCFLSFYLVWSSRVSSSSCCLPFLFIRPRQHFVFSAHSINHSFVILRNLETTKSTQPI